MPETGNDERRAQDALEAIGDAYRAAYAARNAAGLTVALGVRFTENNVELSFPDGSWDAITEEVGPALTFSDPASGGVGIYTAIRMSETPGFLAIRLKVEGSAITEIEHSLSTKRLVSGPPTPFGDIAEFRHDPDLERRLEPAERVARTEMIAIANGYWETLENNTGEIRGTKFSPAATRFENGKRYDEIESGFKLGFYRFNARVRDRDFPLVDEARGLVMSRAFIDHKGLLDHYTLTDGSERHSPFREPHTWSVLEVFKIKHGMITGVETAFIGSPYYQRSSWTPKTLLYK
jgi:hypothetical protein